MSPLRVRGVALSLLALVFTGGLALPARQAEATIISAPSGCLLPDAPTNTPDATVPGTGGTTLRPYVAARIASVGCDWPSDIRAIVLDRHEVRLQAAGRVVRKIRRTGADSGPIGLHALVDLVRDVEWLRREGRTVTVAAAIVQREGTELSIGGESVDEVRLLDEPYVGIVGAGATATFDDVTVVSWSARGGAPVAGHGQLRPFVQYDAGSRVNVSDSVFAWLGSAASGATGVTWSGHSGGTVISTAFSNNYVGVAASDPDQLVFMFNTIRDNVTDGVRVASGSRGATLDTNTMQGNGQDGVVFVGVAGSVVRNNHLWGNSRHGIVLGAGTAATVVVDNVIEPNGVDGIVLEGASGSKIEGNVIGAHRSGIRLADPTTTGNVVSRNLISGSPIGVQISTGTAVNSVVENQITRAAIAEQLTSVPNAPAAAEMQAAAGSAEATPSSGSERQLLVGIGFFSVFLGVCGIGGGLVRRIASRLMDGDSIDLDRRAGPMGKADYVQTSDH